MNPRRTQILRLVPAAAALLAVVCAPASAQESDRFYTGLAFTYSFGDSAHHDGSADLSLGAIEHITDARQGVTVMHLPIVQVPLVRRGEPVVAPVAAAIDAVRWLNGRAIKAADAAVACVKHCELNLSLPDLSGR